MELNWSQLLNETVKDLFFFWLGVTAAIGRYRMKGFHFSVVAYKERRRKQRGRGDTQVR